MLEIMLPLYRTLKTNNMINEFQIRVTLQDYITANPELGIADILNLMFIDGKITDNEYNHLTNK